MLSTALLVNVSSAGLIPGHGTISGGPEKSTSRNRFCGGPASPPRFWRSSFAAIYQCYCQGIDAMALDSSPLYVFIIISVTVSSRQIMKLLPTRLLTMMSMMVTIFRKGRSCLVVHGQYERLMGLVLCLDCLCLGPYCVTPNFFTTPWITSLNGIWRMEISIQIWWTGTL